MMAETEASEVFEVATTKEKCELGLSSYQDPTKLDCNGISHHNQATDHQSPHIYVAEADGLNDDVVTDKDVAFWGSCALPEWESIVDDQMSNPQNDELDAVAVNVGVSDPINGEENSKVEWIDEFPPLVSRYTLKQTNSSEDGDGFQGSFAINRNTKSWLEVVKKPHKPFHVKVKRGFHNFSASRTREVTGDVTVTRNLEVFDSFDVKNGDASNTMLETANMGDQLDVKLNTKVDSLGTLDGCSHGPDEEPPTLPSYLHETVDRVISTLGEVDSVSQKPTLELKQETTLENVTDEILKKTRTLMNQNLTNKGTSEPAPSLVMVSGGDVTNEVQREEAKKSAEDVDLKKKAEEMRMKAVEVKSKELHQLEELEKASEACERSTQQAEKIQKRAEEIALKEAKQKEKAREKRLRKKERKKAAARAKQSKTNKNICWLWMWMGFISIVIFALSWLKRIDVFSNV